MLPLALFLFLLFSCAWGYVSISVHVCAIVSVLGLSVVLNDKWFTDRGHRYTTATVILIVVCHCQACGLLPGWLGWSCGHRAKS